MFKIKFPEEEHRWLTLDHFLNFSFVQCGVEGVKEETYILLKNLKNLKQSVPKATAKITTICPI